MATPGKKPSAIKVIRDRNTVKLPPMQLGSFPKLFDPDVYEGKSSFKARLHVNAAGLAALEATLQAKCIDAHFATMKKEVDEEVAEAKAAKKTPALVICEDVTGCQTPKEWLEEKLKEPHEKDKVQLPTITLKVDAYLPLKKGQDEADREMRTIKFWDAKGKLIGDDEKPASKVLAKMTAGTWLQPVVHANLFASKQLGKAPRPHLQLVGFQIIKLEEWGSGQAKPQDAADDDEMRRIMGDDYSPADDLANLGVGAVTSHDAESGLEMDDQDSPF